MSAKGKTWIVAVSIGVVEALKDQGFARWNYPMRSLKKHAETSLRAFAQAKKLSSSSSGMALSKVRYEKMKVAESMRKVMYLSCWAPN